MIPLRLYIAAGALLASFLAGGYAHMRWTEAKAVKAALAASEQARKVEHENAVSTIRNLDSYSVTMAQEATRAVAVRSDAQRVRDSAAAVAAAASANSCGTDDRPARAAELLGTCVGLLEEGRGYVERLRAQRDALR